VVEKLAARLGRPALGGCADSLSLFLQQVATWNRKIDLTAARDPEPLAEVMLADACVLADAGCIATGARVVDVGSGAGAPIVPLLLLRPDLSALCVEPLQKRATFLRMLTVRLGLLGRMRVEQARLDPERPMLAERFDLATSRATFAPDAWLRIGGTLAPRVLVMTAAGEPLPAPPEFTLEASQAYSLPFSAAPRRLSLYLRG
jgi:16S rRNA (guanine527-N7)-methyltransferase